MTALFLSILFCPIDAQAQSRALRAAPLEDNTESVSLVSYSILQKDFEGKITPETIKLSGGTILKGRLAKGRMIDLGYDGASSWISIRLRNNSSQTDWILPSVTLSEGRLGFIRAFKVYEMGFSLAAQGAPGPAAITLNELRPRSDSGSYKIRLEQNQEKLILINVAASEGKPSIFPITLYTENSFLEKQQNRLTYNIIFCSILGLLSLAFLVWSIIRQDALQVAFGAYFSLAVFEWIGIESLLSFLDPSTFDTVFTAFVLILSLLSLFMTKIFYEVSKSDYTGKYIIYSLAIMNCTATGIALLWASKSDSIQSYILYMPSIITMTGICVMSFGYIREKQIQGSLYLLSWVFPLLGFLMTLFSSLGTLPQTQFLLNAYWYAFIPQGLLLLPSVILNHYLTENYKQVARVKKNNESLHLNRLKETKDTADHSRLLKVIEKERTALAELKEQEAIRVEEMRKAKEMADEANREKSAFLAVVSHEIRTPMTGVMGMVKMLLESNITKQQRDYVLTIQESSESMMALLNDILDFEKIQRGKMELENISFDLHRLIHGVVTLMSGHAAEKGIAMSACIDDNLPKFVKGDPTRLRQVLLNLIGNGIKFTANGSVTLFVKNLNHPELNDMPNQNEKYMVYFSVQDTGIGISAEAQKNLFNPFSQANSSISRKFGGSGLGLAISKGLVESMKSSININSKEGEGSNFFFTLEMERGLQPAQETARKILSSEAIEKPATPIRILVVDDNIIIRKVIISLLSEDKHTIMTTTSAEEALKKIDQNAFDLILMDIELPGMHGNEATRILRGHDDPEKSSLPVIALTGNVGKEDMERYLNDGMTGLLTKPIDATKLKSIINEVAQKTYEREIKMLGDPFENKPQKTQDFAIEIPDKDPVKKANKSDILDSGMLQSLKDTIGTNQLNDLLNDLIAKTDELLQSMIESSKAGDLLTLSARAHELKGMAGNFGLVEISHLAEETEKKAKIQETEGLETLVSGILPEASLRAQTALKNWATH